MLSYLVYCRIFQYSHPRPFSTVNPSLPYNSGETRDDLSIKLQQLLQNGLDNRKMQHGLFSLDVNYSKTTSQQNMRLKMKITKVTYALSRIREHYMNH